MCYGQIIGSVVGGGVSNYQSLTAYMGERRSLDYDAAINLERASLAEKQGIVALEQSDKEQGQRMGRGVTAAASGGVDLSSASASDWARGTAIEHAIEKVMISQNAEQEAFGFSQKAEMDKFQINQAHKTMIQNRWLSLLGTSSGSQAGSAVGQQIDSMIASNSGKTVFQYYGYGSKS